MSWVIWFNARFNAAATERLRSGTRRHTLIESAFPESSVLSAGQSDPVMAQADIAFGQPHVADCALFERIRWVQVTTAGYTRYDLDELREIFRARGAALTTSSAVFADSCAQHILAMILALARELLPSYRDQLGDRPWRYTERRYLSRRLTGETVLLLGFGAIGRRLTELLAPFGCTVYATRRRAISERGVRIIAEADLTRVLPLADHVVNILPDNPGTVGWVNARRLSWFKPGARFYNVGRGVTVDQKALREALESGALAAAYLDVTDPEPLPPEDPLWSAPRCFITPHTAGGRSDQDEAIVEHFLANLALYERGEPLADRVI